MYNKSWRNKKAYTEIPTDTKKPSLPTRAHNKDLYVELVGFFRVPFRISPTTMRKLYVHEKVANAEWEGEFRSCFNAYPNSLEGE
ncbi:conserved hypothetical protein [Ricinus communis]|uniref:Uncharacterized protein n=1 Tax=Ricinus communis TaxID=3988 RepID=B9SII4_RICCO|nr:conserved hypothetical protein [Ricinus communis]